MDPWGLVFRVQVRGRPAREGAPDPFGEGAVRNIPLDVPAGDLERLLAACYHLMWAEDAMAEADFAEALPRYERAAELMDGYGAYLNTLGALCGRRHLRALEETFYRKALAADPGYGLALVNLGRLLEFQGRPAEALALYDRLLALDPQDRWAHDRAVFASRAVRESPVTVAAQIDALRGELRTGGEDPARLRNLGDLYVVAGDPATGLATYRRALEVDPTYAPTYNSLAAFYELVVQDRRTAREYARKARELTPAPETAPEPTDTP
jgi:tetratricopeptide (TPR) repeat protein